MKIKEILILAKLSDNTVRQVAITEAQKNLLLSLLVQTSKGGKIQIFDKSLEWIDIIKREEDNDEQVS